MTAEESLVHTVECQLLRLIEEENKNSQMKDIPEDLLSALHFVFGGPVLQAFDLVDNERVTKFSSPSGRVAFQVRGSSGKLYAHLPSSTYCSCPYYSFTVLKKREAPMCKHALAVLISCALKKCKEADLSDEHLSQLLLNNTDFNVDQT